MKWKTKDGRFLDIRDMTQNHLLNAVKYCVNRDDYDSAKAACDELNRRSEENFRQKQLPCPFCDSTMIPKKYVDSPMEIGFCLDKVSYRYTCQECGATSNEIKGPKEYAPEDIE